MLNKFYLPVFILGIIALSGCYKKHAVTDEVLQRELKTADSNFFIGKPNKGSAMLKQLRAKIDTNSPIIVNYYYTVSEHFWADIKEIDRYADSALWFFRNKERINQYPEAYYHALLAKGDANLRLLRYTSALDFFLRAKKGYTNNICDVGALSGKIADIYYAQNNFKLAAANWLDGYQKMSDCANNRSAGELFYMQQGSLNNIGLAYERAGMLDSASYYYQKDLKLISDIDSLKTIDKPHLNAAYIVTYDNIGGLYLKLGDFALANTYLSKSISIPDPEIDGIRIPPLIKYADLNVRLGNYQKARKAFIHSRRLLNKFIAANHDSEIKWNKVYAQYLVSTGKKDSAYIYLNKYISKKDTLEKNSIEIYRLNIERELKSIQQEHALTDLQQKDKLKMIYLVCAGVVGALSVLVMILIYRNLKTTRRNQRKISLHNQQLRFALDQLEMVNTNNIRIMRMMAHDLRNPLAGMIGIAAIVSLQEAEMTDDSRQMLKLVESTGSHAVEMINELLKTGLADENEQLVKQKIDIRALLFDSVELLQFKATEKQQQIIFESDNDPIIISANHEKLWRTFNNLIVNAIKFSHPNSKIKVGIKHDKKKVLIWVADNGIGIPENQKDIVFEMFTRAKKEGTNGEQPFGLGLSICKRIVEMHKGRIWFDSVEGTGTTFYIELPV